MLSSNHLSIYLNDHLAGATVGVELARRIRASNQQDETFAAPLDRLCTEIEADREALETTIDRLGVSRNRVKTGGAWLGERIGRLKLNGQLRGYSPLSRLLELEGLAMGITGKQGLWETLSDVEGAERAQTDFERLGERAVEQRAAVEELHRLAANRLDPAA